MNDSFQLDASALLALLQGEPGAALVEEKLDRAVIHSINLIEVQRKLLRSGMALQDMRTAIAHLQIPLDKSVDSQQVDAIAVLYADHPDLSLGDCVCIGMAQWHGRTALTTERRWQRMGPLVELLRA